VGHPNGMYPLLWEGRIVNNPRLDWPLDLHGFSRIVPNHTKQCLVAPSSLRNKVVHGLVSRLDMVGIKPGRHGLDAFPITGKDQALTVKSQWLSPIRMANGLRKKIGIGGETRTAFGRLAHR